MQRREFGGVAVMAGHARSGVFGVEDSVGDQLPDVVVVQAVEDGGALAAGPDQPRHPQLRQVLRHRRGGFPDMGCQVIDRHLPAHQRPQNLDAGGIGQHPKHLDDQVHLVIGESTTTSIPYLHSYANSRTVRAITRNTAGVESPERERALAVRGVVASKGSPPPPACRRAGSAAVPRDHAAGYQLDGCGDTAGLGEQQCDQNEDLHGTGLGG